MYTPTNKSNGMSPEARAAYKSRVWLWTALIVVTLLAIAGCQAAPTPVPTPPPPPTATPVPTEPPVVTAKPEEIVGWWRLGQSIEMSLHVETDGTWTLYNVRTEQGIHYGLPGALARGAWRSNGSEWELHRTHGPMLDKSCQGVVGHYDIQVDSEDTRKIVLVEDGCQWGAGALGEPWARTPQLEELLCTWEAEGEQDASVAFRSDLTYAAWRGGGPENGQVVAGTLVWNGPLGQIEIKDDAASPCGPTKVGQYKLSVGADGKATFECVEDLCAERRAALTEWGPFQPSDAYTQIAGRYVGTDKPQYELLLGGCGLERMRMIPDEGEGLLREGAYALEGNQIQFMDVRGDARCKEGPGAYKYTLDGDTLTLEVVADACQARKDDIAACSTWTRVGVQ